MAKAKPKKAKKSKSGGFFAKLFDIIIALIIIGLVTGAVWYWFFYSEENGSRLKDAIKGFYSDKDTEIQKPVKKIKKDSEMPRIDEKADEEEWEKEHGDYIEEDEMSDQFNSEIVSNISENSSGDDSYYDKNTFYSSVNSWAEKYKGMKVKNDSDPDKDRATDNSHLMSAIWKHAADESGRKFSGYLTSEKIHDNIKKIDMGEVKNGDLLILKKGMYGMVINRKNENDYELIYASGEKSKVVVIHLRELMNYWLRPENFKGYYRLEENILN